MCARNPSGVPCAFNSARRRRSLRSRLRTKKGRHALACLPFLVPVTGPRVRELKNSPPDCFLRPAGRRSVRARPLRKISSVPHGTDEILVPVTGLEPVRVLPHGILSPGRLPIPPHRLIGVYIVARTKNCVKKKRDEPACAGHGKEIKDSIDTKLFT